VDDDDFIVDTKTLAYILGVTARRIQQLSNEGKLPRIKDNETGKIIEGRWRLPDCVDYFVRYKVALAVPDADELDEAMKAEKLRKMRADAAIREMDQKFREGSLFRREDVGKVLDAIFGSFHTRLQGVPMKIARDVSGLTDLNRIAELLQEAVNEAEDELRRFDMSELEKYNQQFLADAAARETANPGSSETEAE
jgi:phage terminase Nu1 subunit (DNA packaging protein)